MTSSDVVDNILNFSKDSNDDFYTILNCSHSSNNDQILAEYKVLALQYHPDKNHGDKEAQRRFQILNRAKETLLDPARRSNYDKWLNSGIAISYQQWLNMNEHAQQSLHWANLKTDKRMISENEQSQNPTTAENKSTWTSNKSSSVISKFRNYQI